MPIYNKDNIVCKTTIIFITLRIVKGQPFNNVMFMPIKNSGLVNTK